MRLGSSLVVCVVLSVVYLLTVAPALSWAHHGSDGGDLIRAAFQGSIPHPPGFPTYMTLAEPFIRVPLGNPAWRMNAMSAVFAAAACGLTAAAVPALVDTSSSPLIALTAGLTLGLARLFWSQAVIAEVYTVAAFFSSLVIILALRRAPPWAVGLAWGVGLGAHPTLAFLVPVVVWAARPGVRRGPDGAPSDGRALRPLLGTAAAAAAGWAVVHGPLLLARAGRPSPWASVDNLSGWWDLVSARLYRGYVFALPLAEWPQRLLAWAGLLARQFTPLGALLAGLGLARVWQEWDGLAQASLLAFGAFSLYAVGYDTTDSLVYLVPGLPLAALWLGPGLDRAARWLTRHLQVLKRRGLARLGPALLLLIPLLQGLVFWSDMDLREDRTAVVWIEQTLSGAPERSLLITANDAHTFALWYARDVLGHRPDVVVADRDLWGHPPYRQVMAAELDLPAGEIPSSPEAAARRLGRPVVEVSSDR